MTDFTIIWRSLRGRAVATVVTVVTVAVAVGLMIVLLSMRDAGRQAFQRGTGNMDLLISADGSPLVAVLNGVFYANPPRGAIGWEEYRRLSGLAPFQWAIPTQIGDSYRGFPVLATTGEFFRKFEPNPGEPWRLREGRFFAGPFEVVLGARSARETKLRVGETIYLTHGSEQSRLLGDPDAPRPHVHADFGYTVVGILEPTGSAHDRAVFTDLTSAWIIHAHDRRRAEDPGVRTTTAADLTEADRKITGIYLRVPSRQGQRVSAAKQVIYEQIRRNEPRYTVADPVQQIEALFRIVSNIDRVFIAMAGVVMVSSGVGIMLALYTSMEQRRRQIAVFRVLGASRGRVFGLVLTESAVIGLAGALAGVLLGMAGGVAVAGVLREELGLVVRPVYGPEVVLGVVAGTVVLAALAGLTPAVAAYRTAVANNLRPVG